MDEAALLSQITEAADAAGKVSEAGFVAVLVFFLLLCFMVFCAVAYKLFGTGGIADRLTASHAQFLDRTAAASERTAAAVEDVADANKKIESHVVKIMLRGSTQSEQMLTFVRMWKHNMNVSREMAKKLGAYELVAHNFDELERLIDSLLVDQDLRK